MLNRVILMGRITHNLELKQTQNGTAVLSFNLAVERNYAPQGEERQTDFISCVAWRKTAEFINKYFAKGRMIAIEGNLQTRTYDDKNGVKHYVTEVIVDSVSFTGEPKQQETQQTYIPTGEQRDVASSPPLGNSQSENNSMNGGSHNDIDIDDFEVVISDDGVPF